MSWSQLSVEQKIFWNNLEGDVEDHSKWEAVHEDEDKIGCIIKYYDA